VWGDVCRHVRASWPAASLAVRVASTQTSITDPRRILLAEDVKVAIKDAASSDERKRIILDLLKKPSLIQAELPIILGLLKLLRDLGILVIIHNDIRPGDAPIMTYVMSDTDVPITHVVHVMHYPYPGHFEAIIEKEQEKETALFRIKGRGSWSKPLLPSGGDCGRRLEPSEILPRLLRSEGVHGDRSTLPWIWSGPEDEDAWIWSPDSEDDEDETSLLLYLFKQNQVVPPFIEPS